MLFRSEPFSGFLGRHITCVSGAWVKCQPKDRRTPPGRWEGQNGIKPGAACLWRNNNSPETRATVHNRSLRPETKSNVKTGIRNDRKLAWWRGDYPPGTSRANCGAKQSIACSSIPAIQIGCWRDPRQRGDPERRQRPAPGR